MNIEGLRVCKLVSGEFVIGRLVAMNLINFFLISFKANSLTGAITLNMSPYMAPLDNSLNHVMDLTKIMAIAQPTPEMVQQYVNSIASFVQAQKKAEVQNEQTPVSGGTDTPPAEQVEGESSV